MTRRVLGAIREQKLFWRFTVLSFLAFAALTAYLVAAVAPAIEQFVITEQEREAVVFINRFAQRNLQASDFIVPASPAAAARLDSFLSLLPVRGIVSAVLLDGQGRLLAAMPDADASYVAWVGEEEGYVRAMRELESTVGFQTLNPAVSPQGIAEAMTMYVPITIGADETPVAVLHTVARTGFIREAIDATRRELTNRILLSLVGLYLILSVIVYGASRTIVRQNTQLAETAERLRQSLVRERELSAAKGRFVEIASHQLKTPVTEIGWALEIFSAPKAGKAERAAAMAGIESGHHALQSIIFDLLTVSELGFTYTVTSPAPVRLGELTARVRDVLAETAKDAEVTVAYAPMPAVPEVLGSAVTVERAVRNLLENAITYSRPGGTVLVDIRAERGGVRWEVRDQGIGVPPEDRGSLFTQFFRAKNAVERKNVGTGLGLFIAKTVVEGHGGEVRYQPDSSGVGSRFSFWLPSRPPPPQSGNGNGRA